jgi:hypothetical protein
MDRNRIAVCTLRLPVSKLQDAGEGYSLHQPVFFWLTALERLDRLPQVFGASSDTTIRS